MAGGSRFGRCVLSGALAVRLVNVPEAIGLEVPLSAPADLVLERSEPTFRGRTPSSCETVDQRNGNDTRVLLFRDLS